MKTLGNILWVIFGGFFWALALFIAGIFSCIIIIGIPVGLQLFKMAKFVLWPFGKQVVNENVTGFKAVLNILWAIFFGWEYALGFFFWGAVLCITIIGIPFGKQYFKLGSFIFLPLGRNIK